MELSDIEFSSEDHLYPLIVLVLSARTFLLNLEEAAIQGYDEGLYAVGATHVFDGYWLVPRYTLASGPGDFVPHLQKPPLVPWVQSISMFIFGDTAFAARLPSALAGVLVAVVIFYLGREFVDARVGLIAAIVFATTPQVFTGTNAFRQATTDGILVLLGSLFIWFTWLAIYRDTRYFYAVGILAPLLVLTKSVQAGIFVIAVLPIVLLNFRRLLSREFAATTVATVAVVGAWFVQMYLNFGNSFVDQMFVSQLIDRPTGGFVSYEGVLFGFMKYPYFENLFSLWDPWVYFFIAGLFVLPLIHGRGTDDWLLLSVWSTLAIFVFFVLTGNHAHYILPMYITGAIVVATLVRDALDEYRIARAGLLAGFSGVVLFSPRFVSPLAFQWTGLWGNKPGDIVLVPLVAVLLFVVLFHVQISKLFRSYLGEGGFEDVKPSMIVILVLTFGFAISSPAIIQHGYSAEKQSLALEGNRQVPDSATIYFSESSPVSLEYLTVEFYSQHEFRGVTKDELESNPSIRYAILLPTTGPVNRTYDTVTEIRPNSPNQMVKIIEFE